MKKALLFDLDGTLLDSFPGLLEALNRALVKNRFPALSPEGFFELVSLPAREMVAKSLPEALQKDESLIRRIREDYSLEYRELMCSMSPPFPGIREMLVKAHELGHLLFIFTGKRHSTSLRLADALLPPVFTAVLGAGIYPDKPDPAGALALLASVGAKPEEALYLGDAETDFFTCKNGGIPFLGAGWGYRGEDYLRGLGAKKILKSPCDLFLFL